MTDGQRRLLRSIADNLWQKGFSEKEISRAIHSIAGGMHNSPSLEIPDINEFLQEENLPQLSSDDLNGYDYQE